MGAVEASCDGAAFFFRGGDVVAGEADVFRSAHGGGFDSWV